MPRTTLDIDASVLRELKKRARQEGKSLGRVASELLASALVKPRAASSPAFRWESRPMGARVDLEDKDAMFAVLEGK